MIYPTKKQGDQPPTEGFPPTKPRSRLTLPRDGQDKTAAPKSASRGTGSEAGPDRNDQDNTNLTTEEEYEAVNGQVAHQDEDHESESEEDLGTLGTLRIGPAANTGHQGASAEDAEVAALMASPAHTSPTI
jgi:hypothetical protein